MIKHTDTGQLMRRRSGLSIIEVLVVIAICGLLVAMILPAVQSARERSRRMSCSSNLRQIGLAIEAYDGVYGVLPAHGGPGAYSPTVLIRILPFLDQAVLYQQILDAPGTGMYQQVQLSPPLAVFVCPSGKSFGSVCGTHYFVNLGTGHQKYGVNGYLGGVSASAYLDGLSNTAFFSEFDIKDVRNIVSTNPLNHIWQTERVLQQPDELELFADYCDSMVLTSNMAVDYYTCWIDFETENGYNHVLPPMHRSCVNGFENQFGADFNGATTASGGHASGVNSLFGDGSVRFIGKIDRRVWRAAGSRDGSETISME